MHLVSALYDAPVPAGLALASLIEAGASPQHLGVWPPLPPLAVAPPAATLLASAPDRAAALGLLAQLGLPPDALQQADQGLGRGATLVLARCPDLDAPAMAAAMAEAGPIGGF